MLTPLMVSVPGSSINNLWLFLSDTYLSNLRDSHLPFDFKSLKDLRRAVDFQFASLFFPNSYEWKGEFAMISFAS